MAGVNLNHVTEYKRIEYTIGDGRKVRVGFSKVDNGTHIVEIFEAEDIAAIQAKFQKSRQAKFPFNLRDRSSMGCLQSSGLFRLSQIRDCIHNIDDNAWSNNCLWACKDISQGKTELEEYCFCIDCYCMCYLCNIGIGYFINSLFMEKAWHLKKNTKN